VIFDSNVPSLVVGDDDDDVGVLCICLPINDDPVTHLLIFTSFYHAARYPHHRVAYDDGEFWFHYNMMIP
jgi:hypothetical protein